MKKLLGKAHDPEFWKLVRESDDYKKYRDDIYNQWSRALPDYTPDCLKYSEYKLFWTTGNRSIFEAHFFKRRHTMILSAIMALIYPDEPKHLEQLMDIIFCICDEYSWCLPAHQGPLEPNNNSRIDLFASETAYMLAEIYTLLEDRLDPLIKNRIMAETERRIVKPFMSVENYGWWENGTMNWTAVCMGSVACTMMLLYPELADDKFIDRANRAMEGFLTGFLDDGICFEGCGYWGYGFGFFLLYADMVRTYTDGRVDFFKREKVKTVSMFPQRMFLSGNASVSFADGGRTMTYNTGRMHYLKHEYPDDIIISSPKYAVNSEGKFSSTLRSATWFVPEYAKTAGDDNVSSEYFAPESQWFVKRTANYGFATKGGNNNEFHNHNDVGSFIFAKNGKQILMDLGSGLYTRQYFAPDTRYGILECASRGHSVPMIGGTEQFFGSNAKASYCKYENGIIETEFAGAYHCDGLNSLKRSFSFTDDAVTLIDNFDYFGSGEIVDRIVTLIEPTLKDEHTVVVDCAEITFDPSICDCVISSEERERKDLCYMIDFKLKNGVNKFSCTIK